MMKKIIIGCLFCAGLSVMGTEADEHTLFYCSFDKKLEADSAAGANSFKGHASLTTDNGGKFGEALIIRDEECVSPSEIKALYKFLKAQPKDNYNAKTGTLEMWFKLGAPVKNFPDKVSNLSSVLYSISHYDNFGQPSQWMTLRLVYSRWQINLGKNRWFIEVEINDKDKPRQYNGQDWLKNQKRAERFRYIIDHWTEKEWHHLAFTWDKQQFQLFVDGKSVAARKCRFNGILAEPATKLLIGGSYGKENYALPCLIDELHVSDIVRYQKDFTPGK